MPQTALIQIRNLSRSDAANNQLILDCVDLAIHEGDRIGLIGPTGSGKSSLLRAIAKLDRSDSGDVYFQSHLIRRDDVPAFRRQVIYLPQRSEFTSGSVRENLEVPFRLSLSTGHLDATQVNRWLEDLSMPVQTLQQSIESLSGGQRQIVALLCAMTLSPRVMLLDEPTAALDPELTEKYERLVLAWCEGVDPSRPRRAFVWTSHDVHQVRRMTTQIIAINKGSLSTGNTDD